MTNREKILAYLKKVSQRADGISKTFTLRKITHLEVGAGKHETSSMAREFRQMKTDGIIDYEVLEHSNSKYQLYAINTPDYQWKLFGSK
jgi:hypothetical protein